MSIPIANLYYLFMYAWDHFRGGPLGKVGGIDGPNVANLLASLLVDKTRQALRRGLNREYKEYVEELRAPRGKILVGRVIKEGAQLRGTTVCLFDELTHDVTPNRIMKATLRSLVDCKDIGKDQRHAIGQLLQKLHDVNDVRLSKGLFRTALLNQRDREYRFIIHLCDFIHSSIMPDVSGGSARFQNVLEDEIRMSAVFESFLRNFYRIHIGGYRVRAERKSWHVSDATEFDISLLPQMKTDITLRGPGTTIIVDAKYYKSILSNTGYGERVRSSHLYQLMTYLQHECHRNKGTPVAGILIYPEVGHSVRLKYRLLGVPVLIATINLDQDWSLIESDLLSIIEASEQLAVLPTS